MGVLGDFLLSGSVSIKSVHMILFKRTKKPATPHISRKCKGYTIHFTPCTSHRSSVNHSVWVLRSEVSCFVTMSMVYAITYARPEIFLGEFLVGP